MDKEDVNSIVKVREIKEEIIRYGVTQEELKQLIFKLSLELEDNNLMKNISLLINKDDKPKLVL